jgi:hypothetical protein
MELMIFQFALLLSLNGFLSFYSCNKLLKFSVVLYEALQTYTKQLHKHAHLGEL